MSVEVILGQRGTGKSTLLDWRVREARRLLLIDTMSEHAGGMVVSFSEFLDVLPAYHCDRFRFVVRELEPDDFEDLCRWALRMGDLTFAVDEVDMWSLGNNRAAEGLDHLTRYGRHSNVNLIVTGRRPVDVPRLLTSQIDTLYTYRQVEPDDLKWLRAVTGRPDLAGAVAELPDFTVAVWEARDRETIRTGGIVLTDGAAELRLDGSGTPGTADDAAHHDDREPAGEHS